MARPTLHYIGKPISIKSIQHAILDLQLGEKDTLLLHSTNFDDIVLEYRNTYKVSMPIPYFLLGVLVKGNVEHRIPEDRVGVVKEDVERFESDYRTPASISEEGPDDSHAYDVIFRCGWCGNIVDNDGSEFDPQTRQFKISIHQAFESTVTVTPVHGKCCPNGHEDRPDTTQYKRIQYRL